LTLPVASGKTDAHGKYRIRFSPTSTGKYEVTTGQISQIENSTLNPPFGDLLSPGATAAVALKVQSAIVGLKVRVSGGKLLIKGSVAPRSGHVKATVTVLARRVGSKGGFKRVALDRLGVNKSRFKLNVQLAAGQWQVEVTFKAPGQLLPSTSRPVTLTVP
jgi:hypothetical protein